MNFAARRAAVAFALLSALISMPLASVCCAAVCQEARAGLMSKSAPACHHESRSPGGTVEPAASPCAADEMPAISNILARSGNGASSAPLIAIGAAWLCLPVHSSLPALCEPHDPPASIFSSSPAPLRL